MGLWRVAKKEKKTNSKEGWGFKFTHQKSVMRVPILSEKR